MDPQNKHGQNPTLTNDGARRALNYITDIAKKRKKVVTFIFDEESGNIKAISDSSSGKDIDVHYRTTRT